MTDLKPVFVGEPGRNYVLSLMEGVPGLCSKLSKTVASGGQCYGIVAEGSSLDRALNFEGSPGTRKDSDDGWLTQRVRGFADAGQSGVLMIQDLWFSPEDHAGEPRPQTDFWFHNNEVYFWSGFSKNSSPDVDLLFRQSNSFNVVAFLVKDPNVVTALRAGLGDIELIAKNVKEIYALAYDQESFVMWVR